MNRSPAIGSFAGAELPGSARLAVAPHPLVSRTAVATKAAPSFNRLTIIISFIRGLDGRGFWAYQAITGGRDDNAIANRALSACGDDGRCGLNVRIQIVAGTSLDATMTETNSPVPDVVGPVEGRTEIARLG